MHIVHATVDGVTLVTDTAKAFDRLPAENKKYLLTHGFLAPETGVAHPIVRPHPLTGRTVFTTDFAQYKRYKYGYGFGSNSHLE